MSPVCERAGCPVERWVIASSTRPRPRISPSFGSVFRCQTAAVIVRPYEPPDRDGVLALVERLQEGVAAWRGAAAVRAAMDKWVREEVDSDATGARAVFVAEEDGEIIGFATASTRRHFAGDIDAYVGELAVARHVERRGVGRQLMVAAEEWARRQGLARVSLDTGAANSRARAFYAALGYEEEDVRLTKRLEA
jgi:GNAT superfamily N-acetyltransferase